MPACSVLLDGRPLTAERMLTSIRVLKVAGCSKLTDEMVHDVATRCTMLEVRGECRCGGLRARFVRAQRLSLSTCGIMSNGAMYMLGGVPITHIDMKTAVTLSSINVTTDVSTITHTAKAAARANPVLTAAVAVTLRSRNPLVSGSRKVAFGGDSSTSGSPKLPKSPTHVSSLVTTASDAAEILDRAERAKTIIRSMDATDADHGIQFNRHADPFDPDIIEDMPDYHKRHRKPVAVPNLLSLDISLCTDVTDEGLEYLTSRCTRLQVRRAPWPAGCPAPCLTLARRISTCQACSDSVTHKF